MLYKLSGFEFASNMIVVESAEAAAQHKLSVQPVAHVQVINGASVREFTYLDIAVLGYHLREAVKTINEAGQTLNEAKQRACSCEQRALNK